MQKLTITIKQQLGMISLGVLFFTFNVAVAKSDMQMMGEVQKSREMSRQHKDHSGHKQQANKNQKFYGVFYGYLPCKDCDGIKSTLSLKNKNNYLLVTQYARTASREFFEKGKYTWDDKTRMVTLISRKDSGVRKYRIKDEKTLIQLNSNGSPMKGNQDKYALRRSDAVKTRAVHIH